MDLNKFYDISERALIEELEAQRRRVNQELETLQTKMNKLAKSVDKLTLEVHYARNSRPRRWIFDARLPNYMLKGVYDVEYNGEAYKRWVGPDNCFQLTVSLARTFQHQLTVSVVEFAQADSRESFYLKVDGESVPWMSIIENEFGTIIPAREDRPIAEIEVGVVPDAIDSVNKVAFSFSRLEIYAL